MKVNIRLNPAEIKQACAEWLQNNTAYDVRPENIMMYTDESVCVVIEAQLEDRIID